jgi:hypothetical protein
VIEVMLAPLAKSGGVRVPAVGAGLRLLIDGKDRGSLPAVAVGLTPGEHVLQLVGNDSYAKFEQRVTVEAGKVTQLEPEPRVIKGRARIESGMQAEGAEVLLECRDRDPVPIGLPALVTLEPERKCRLVARKPGFEPVAQKLVFGQCDTQKTFMVDLVPATGGAHASGPEALAFLDDNQASVGKQKPHRAKGKRRKRAGAGRALFGGRQSRGGGTKGKSSAASANGRGVINISSIPSARVLVDGRPVGDSPKRVRTSAGTHTVIFIHPIHGRKAVRVRVTPDGNVHAAARFGPKDD